ncbi:uncharacterized protein METZ01_LOCUS348043, partial [marine metagenome]
HGRALQRSGAADVGRRRLRRHCGVIAPGVHRRWHL